MDLLTDTVLFCGLEALDNRTAASKAARHHIMDPEIGSPVTKTLDNIFFDESSFCWG